MRHANPAESLIETLVAITVIVLATTAALSVLRTSVRGNEVIGQKTVAINLALEGFEALKNIRDTNYLLMATNPDDCWDTYGLTDVADCASSSSYFKNNWNYYFTRSFDVDPMFQWQVVRLTNTNTQGFIDLYGMDLDGDSNGDTNIYAQSNITTVTGLAAQTSNRRIFQRYVTISNKTTDSYDATMTVLWTENGVKQSIELTRSIFNVY